MAFGLHDDLPEDAAERASFDRAKNSLYDGRALAAIAAALTQMSKANPENGSLSKMLACWCKPGEPCHADVLLEIANR